MFNIDELEKKWQEYYIEKTGKDKLSDKDILEIYKSENATEEYYDMLYEQHREKYKIWFRITDGTFGLTPEQRMINAIFGYHSNVGWDEDISNIDKEEFLRQFEEDFYLHSLDNQYEDEELNREDFIRQQLRAEDKYDFSKLHEDDDDFLSSSEINPEDFGVDKNFIKHEPSYYVVDYIFDEDYEYDYKYECNHKDIQEQLARKRNIATRILMEKCQLEEPKKKHLSPEKQKEVIEGCMYLVFGETRYWDEVTGHVFDIEELYYICLYTLINSAKYCCHCRKPVFSMLVDKNIRTNMYGLIGRRMHLTYREIYQKINDWELEHIPTDENDHQLYNIPEKPFKEIPTDPKEMFLMTKDTPTDDEYQKESKMFMEAYYQEVGKLDGLERSIMSMSYDNNGYLGLTEYEISRELIINDSQVSYLKNKAKTKIKEKILNNIL